jgi:hypothetical protein
MKESESQLGQWEESAERRVEVKKQSAIEVQEESFIRGGSGF